MPRRPSIRRRTATIVRKAREDGRSGAEFEALALIAEEFAETIDRFGEDGRTRLGALKELRSTLAELAGAGRERTGRDAGDSAGAGGRGDVGGRGDLDRELADLMGAPPVRGDA